MNRNYIFNDACEAFYIQVNMNLKSENYYAIFNIVSGYVNSD